MTRIEAGLLAMALGAAQTTDGAPGAAAQKPETRSERRVEVTRSGSAYLGVTLDEVSRDDVLRLKLPDERGALVKTVEADSPAAKAGLKPDDVILRFQGESVLTARELARLVRDQPVGRNVALELIRGGARQTLQATLGEQERASHRWRFRFPDLGRFGLDFDHDMEVELPEPPEPPEPPEAPEPPGLFGPRFSLRSEPRRLGIEYQEIGAQLARYFKLAGDRGVLVTSVDPESPASAAGVKAGDVILKLDGREVRDGGDLREAIRKAAPGGEVALAVQRDGKPLELKAKLAEPARRNRSGVSS